MLFNALAAVTLLATGAQAHYRLNYPLPRGPFVSNLQPNFCGGYDDVTTNRTTFSLNDGFFRIRQGHADWSASVLISTVPNPNTFDSFNTGGAAGAAPQLAREWATEALTGNFCIPLPLGDTGIPGVVDGANVTIQIVLTGGDGQLYQCADLTLSATHVTPADEVAACQNQTAEDTHHAAAPSETAGAGNGAGSGALSQFSLPIVSGLVAGLAGVGLAIAGL
ncbi:hypothetical protein FA15DRAFT_366259 [Coprinopsis marcescibilis]|uniref:Copper acquisition factor BIM1-like domain-containing protein n=1 Tax=Coprinopsis marcescibilis TaxID=230819 RepID=A0A5C3KAV1_COPMA|nr:hypothetical protein FA15DRAFT_366259 [Coprinopsis marcescibilis]